MNKDTIITYTAGGNSVTFWANAQSDMWVTSVDAASGNSISISETQGAGQTGSTVTAQAVQPKDITINGAVIRNVEANRTSILGCILPGVPGRLTVQQNGSSWFLDCVPKQTPIFSDGAFAQCFQFVLRAPFPYWKSTEDGTTTLASLTKLFRLPRSFAGTWAISRYSQSQLTTVDNTGMESAFEVTFYATTSVVDPELYHMEKGAFIRLHKTMAAGEAITVSTVYGKKGVVLLLADGTQQNGFRYLDVDSDLNLTLAPGVNTLRCAAAENREGLTVTIAMPKEVRAGL